MGKHRIKMYSLSYSQLKSSIIWAPTLGWHYSRFWGYSHEQKKKSQLLRSLPSGSCRRREENKYITHGGNMWFKAKWIRVKQKINKTGRKIFFSYSVILVLGMWHLNRKLKKMRDWGMCYLENGVPSREEQMWRTWNQSICLIFFKKHQGSQHISSRKK